VSNLRWGDTAGWFSAVATALAAGFVLVQIWPYRREQTALPGLAGCSTSGVAAQGPSAIRSYSVKWQAPSRS